MIKKPHYNFQDFKMACAKGENVQPIFNVLKDAKEIFNLNNLKELLNFIANDGLEELRYFNTTKWKGKNDKLTNIPVDGYEFRSVSIYGYIAFFKSPVTQEWIIKSFHYSERANMPLRQALEKLKK